MCCIERRHEPPGPWSQEPLKIRQGAQQQGKMGSWQSSGVAGLPLKGVGWWPFKERWDLLVVGQPRKELRATKELRMPNANFLLGSAFCKDLCLPCENAEVSAPGLACGMPAALDARLQAWLPAGASRPPSASCSTASRPTAVRLVSLFVSRDQCSLQRCPHCSLAEQTVRLLPT